MRHSKADVYGTFRVLCKTASKVCTDQVAESDRPCVGAWELDYMPYSGYTIKEVAGSNEYKFPLGLHFRDAGEMIRTMEFGIKLLERR